MSKTQQSQDDILQQINAETDASLVSFKPGHVLMTQAKGRRNKARAASRSQDGGLRMNCGNLSLSIQDQKPKGYEKTTVSYVSKVISNEAGKKSAGSSRDLFKHLKNTTMGGNGDFFRGSGTSLSNKKQYKKLLVK